MLRGQSAIVAFANIFTHPSNTSDRKVPRDDPVQCPRRSSVALVLVPPQERGAIPPICPNLLPQFVGFVF